MNPPECRGEFAIAVAKGVGMAEGDTEAPPGEPHARSIVDAPMHKATAPRTSIQFRGSEGAWMEYGLQSASRSYRARDPLVGRGGLEPASRECRQMREIRRPLPNPRVPAEAGSHEVRHRGGPRWNRTTYLRANWPSALWVREWEARGNGAVLSGLAQAF